MACQFRTCHFRTLNSLETVYKPVSTLFLNCLKFGMSGNGIGAGPSIKQCTNRFLHCFQTVSKQCVRCHFRVMQRSLPFPHCFPTVFKQFRTLFSNCFRIGFCHFWHGQKWIVNSVETCFQTVYSSVLAAGI